MLAPILFFMRPAVRLPTTNTRNRSIIAAIIADEMAIGVINDKTSAVRLIPVPGAKAGDRVDFGGLFGATPVMEVRNAGASDAFVHFGGRIPAPLQSLGN